MRMWARNTGRAALVAAGALAVGAAFGSGASAGADTVPGGLGSLLNTTRSLPLNGTPIENARHGGGGGVDMKSSGNFGLLNGNQVYVPISIPVNVCGNAIAIAGASRAQCKGGASVSSSRSHDGYDGYGPGYRTSTGWGGDGGYGGGHGGQDVNMQTSRNFGLLNGNQVYAPISVPVNVCGNSVAVFGLAQSRCKGGASVERSADRRANMQSSGNFGALNGNQVFIPIKVPVNVCGNAVAVFGLAQAQCKGGASVGDGKDEMPPTLRTPPKKHKVYKPSKHRPAAGHKKLPSTMRASNSRMARPGADYRSADGLPAVQDFVDSLKRSVRVPGVDVQPGQIGPKVPMDDGAPVTVGSPVTR